MKMYVKTVHVRHFHVNSETMYVLVHWLRLILTTPLHLWLGNIYVSLFLVVNRWPFEVNLFKIWKVCV